MRSALVVLLSLATGCYTTGGKVFGTGAVASGVASVYLLTSSTTTIEGHQLVTHDDHQGAGVALMFAAVIAASGWAISEIMYGPRAIGGGGGLPPGIEPLPPPVVESPVVESPVAESPVAESPVAEPVAEPPPPPVVEPAPSPAAEPLSGPPTVVIVRDHGRGGQVRPRGGWRLDPQDGLDRLYGPDGELRGWINPAGYVWYRTGGAAIGQVDATPRCGPACRHTQARQMLDRLR